MITVLGAGGFIGSRIVEKLVSENIKYYAPRREDDLREKELGDIIYCIGLTSDFRKKPFATVEAHVCKLLEILTTTQFDSLLYLSSTRLYGSRSGLAKEDVSFYVNPRDPSDLYNISKLMGEALLNASERHIRIARLSNVFGMDVNSDNFLLGIIKNAVQMKYVMLETSLESEKDYVNIDDVVDLLIKIASGGKHKIYNVASGVNVSNRQIMNALANLTGCVVDLQQDAKTVKYPVISIETAFSEFGYHPSSLLDKMEELIALYQNYNGEEHDYN